MTSLKPISSNDYWESVFSNRSWGLYPPEELVRFIGRNFKKVPEKNKIRILEIGCGPGPNIWFLAREGFMVAGIDGSSIAISQAEERLLSENLLHKKPMVDLKVGNFASLPWNDGYFDSIIDIEALYSNNITDIKKTLAEVFRTLKLGGKFFGKMFGLNTTGSDSGMLLEPGTYLNPLIGPCAGNAIAHFFSKEELIDLFSKFSEVTIDYSMRSDQDGKIEIYEWIVIAKK